MSNSYAGLVFTVDTSTNIAGLTALKGSAPDIGDAITIIKDATLTVESNLNCGSIWVGYAGQVTSNPDKGHLIVNDGVVITLNASSTIYVNSGSSFITNGTMVSLGTGNGAIDQTFNLAPSKSTAIKVNGEWWTRVPNLNGLRSAISGSTNTTYCTVTASSSSILGINPGDTVEIRTMSTGNLVGTRVVTSLSSNRINWTGSLSVTAAEGVYKTIAGTEKVYMTNGTQVIFGDGTDSAWDNNGGAVCPNNATVESCGILITTNTISNIAFTDATINFTGTHFIKSSSTAILTGVSRCSNIVIDNCAISDLISGAGLELISCNNSRISNSVFFGNSTYGLALSSGCDIATLSNNVFYNNAVAGNYFSICSNITVDGCRYVNNGPNSMFPSNSSIYSQLRDTGGSANTVKNSIFSGGTPNAIVTFGSKDFVCYNNTITASASSGIYLMSTKNSKFFNNTIYGNTMAGITISTGNKNLNIINNRIYSNGLAINVTGTSDGSTVFSYKDLNVGNTGILYWNAADADLANGIVNPNSLVLTTKDVYVTLPATWIPGLVSYGNVSITKTDNNATSNVEYRVSHDNGLTWTAWAVLGASIADTPDIMNEWIQFRFIKTDADTTAWPVYQNITIAVTFDSNWTPPINYSPVGLIKWTSNLTLSPVKNITQTLMFPLQDTTGVGSSNKSIKTYLSQNGGAFTATTNLPTELIGADGLYNIVLTDSELNIYQGVLLATDGVIGTRILLSPLASSAGGSVQVDEDVIASAVWEKVIYDGETASHILSAIHTDTQDSFDIINNGSINANLTAIDGNPTNNNSATLALKKLDLNNLDGPAFEAHSADPSGVGTVAFHGAGVAPAFALIAGASGPGLHIQSGTIPSESTHAVNITALAGTGIHVHGGTDSAALALIGNGTGPAAYIAGGQNGGDGLKIQGGGTGSATGSGNGIRVYSGQTAGDAVVAHSQGPGADIRGNITGNVTGNILGSVDTIALPDKDGYTLASSEYANIANEVESQIIDDTDNEKVLQAIVDKIATVNPSFEDITLSAIASAVRTELTTELGRIDTNVSTRLAASSYDSNNNYNIAVIRKILTNKIDVNDNNVIVYDDNGVSVFGTFSWNEETGLRGAMV